MPDIADQIDAALGAAPPDAPRVDATLALGRRALRRRRAAYLVGAAATALVIGGTAWATAPGDDGSPRTENPGFSGEVSDSASPDPTKPVDGGGTAEPWVFGDEAAALMEDGTIVTKPGWAVVDTIEEPSGPNTVAVDVTNGEKHQWFLWSGAGTLHVPQAPDRDYDSFSQWVTVNGPTMVADPGFEGDLGGGWPGIERDDLVRFTAPQLSGPEPGTLLPLHDTQIIEQRPGVDVGGSFAAPGDVTGVAMVASEGSRTFVLARVVDGGPTQYIAVPATRVMDTLDEFIAFARERYAEGGGGLL
jgi:hypothetical protein